MTENKVICYELGIFIEEENKDLLASILGELGIHDFVLGSLDCDIPAEYNPQMPKPDFYSELANDIPAIIYSEDKEYLESVKSSLEHVFKAINFQYNEKTFIIREIADQNWKESWKASFKPILISDQIAILPPWENINKFNQLHKIVINPGMAFGTGQHETTRLCLEVMLNYKMPESVLDVGTGSGILAIAAKKLGAVHVLGNDLDPDCMRIAYENSEVNETPQIKFINIPIEQIEDKNFGMILANIESKPLKSVVPSICDHAKKNGIIILSGILSIEIDEFKEFMQNKNVRFVLSKIMGDWCSLVYEKL